MSYLAIHPTPAGVQSPAAVVQGAIPVTRADLPLACPPPGQGLWDLHPRVYLPIAQAPDREAVCPYCGARYRLTD